MKLPPGGFLAFIGDPKKPAALPIFPSPAFETRLELGFLQVNLVSFSTSGYFRDEAQGITIVLYGHVCGAGSPQKVMERYLSQGQSFYRCLNGSFVLLVVDEREEKAIVVLDRAGSRPAYISQQEGGWLVSTSLESQYRKDYTLDPAGVAWYLTNGVQLNRRTLFKEIRRLGHASAFEFRPGKVEQNQYWDYAYTGEFAGRDVSLMKGELSELLVQSVRRRVPPSNPVFLSLSYGYDASGILAILKNKLNVKDVRTFSYGLDEGNPQSDPPLARGLAGQLDCEHTFIPSYDGDICDVIETNALWWDGAANFCDEACAWKKIEGMYGGQHYSLFTGEELFGESKIPLADTRDIMAFFVNNLDNLGRALSAFPAESRRLMRSGMKSDYEEIIRRFPPQENMWDLLDFLDIDQMECNLTFPWRPLFAGRTFEVLEPLLDADILDFMKKVPTEWRNDRILYRETISAMFPDFYAAPRASVGGYIPNWKAELNQKRGLITQRYIHNGRPSKLDRLIPPATLARLLFMQDEDYLEKNTAAGKLLGMSRRAVNKIMGRRERYKKQLKTHGLLLSCLVLRRFLERLDEEAHVPA